MSGYTPGPWVNDNGLVTGRESRTRYNADGSLNTCSIDIFNASNWPEDLDDEAQANASLIAAALQMLEALRPLAALFDAMGGNRLTSVDESDFNFWVQSHGDPANDVKLTIVDARAAHTAIAAAEAVSKQEQES